MQENKIPSKNLKEKAFIIFKKIATIFGRWFFMASLLLAAAFCVFVWYSYIWKADWDEAKKQSYISEQAKFSFDRMGYQKMVEFMKNRKDKFENFPKFSGKDIFFPEGF